MIYYLKLATLLLIINWLLITQKISIYTINDEHGCWVESWSFDKKNESSLRSITASVGPKRYVNSKSIGVFSGKLNTEVVLEYYNGGGIYQQFNKLIGKTYWVDGWSYLNVDRSASWMEVAPINPTNRGVWPSVGVEVTGSFIVTAQLSVEGHREFDGLLIKAGFSVGKDFYYSKYIPQSYTIKLHSGW